MNSGEWNALVFSLGYGVVITRLFLSLMSWILSSLVMAKWTDAASAASAAVAAVAASSSSSSCA